jgi:16S rRNA (guanine(1405)-N(7))-methyltransferase
MTMRNSDQEKLVIDILNMPKYRNLGLLKETIRDVVSYEFDHHETASSAEKTARKKIHNVVAAYLGNPDYSIAKKDLTKAVTSTNPETLKTACRDILRTHVSTNERLPEIETMYQKIFSVTGRPSSILDLACGLNPLTFPWMELPASTCYYAYDIVGPRIDLINHFFSLQKLIPFAETRDILINPPSIAADIAFILKEIHRFEQRKKDSSYHLYNSLNVKYIIVSLPAQSIHSKHDFTQSYRTLFFKTLHELQWPTTEIIVGQEMFFIIEKTGQ